MVAALHAIAALEAEAATVLSLGASSFGATDAEFHLLDIHDVLQEALAPGVGPIAVTLGGSRDVGGEFDPAFRDSLLATLEARGEVVLVEPDLTQNVAARMAAYRGVGTLPAAFVNIGGAEANLGTSPLVLSVPPGLVRPSGDGPGSRLPPESQRGVLFQMVADGVPVIHLLHIRGLALRYGLPWDPIPLPPAGTTRLLDTEASDGPLFWALSVLYLAGLVAVFLRGRRSRAKEVG
jgi:poly-gamma-glutamate system protein